MTDRPGRTSGGSGDGAGSGDDLGSSDDGGGEYDGDVPPGDEGVATE